MGNVLPAPLHAAVLGGIALLSWLSAAVARADEIVSLPTCPGVTQSYLLATAQTPKAVAVLLPGGDGNIHLRMENGVIAFNPGNFLVRSRNWFTADDVTVAILDSPSDMHGMNDAFRMGTEHTADVKGVVADLKTRFPSLPVYLIGTSRGTVSAAYAGRALGDNIAGVVLTSSVILANRKGGSGLSDFDYATLKQPVLLVHHGDDGCGVCPYQGAQKIAQEHHLPLITVHGGKPAESAECDPFSAHGYFGKERETVDAITQWIFGKPYPAIIE